MTDKEFIEKKIMWYKRDIKSYHDKIVVAKEHITRLKKELRDFE